MMVDCLQPLTWQDRRMSERHPDHEFPATQWTLIRRLHSEDTKTAARALEEICRQYQYPLYCFIRRRDVSHHDAEDILQEFFTMLLRRDALLQAEAPKGRLRGYLSTALRRFLSNWRQQEHRRAGVTALAPDETLERRYAQESLSDADTPERLYDLKFTLVLVQAAVDALQRRYHADGKGPLFDALAPTLVCGGTLREESDNAARAASLELSEGAMRTAMTRLRTEFREAIRREVREIVDDPAEVDEELAALMACGQPVRA